MGKMVYTCFCTDVIHEGHMNILKRASEYGDVYVGVLSDEAMVGFNRFPTISLEQRMEIVRQTGLVKEVLIQRDVMYDQILTEMRPDYVVHGDNWSQGPEKAIRDNVVANLDKLGGELVGIPETYKTLEVHSGLTGLIAEKTVVETGGRLDQFDAMWISSLCDSTAKGKPDIELVDMSSRIQTIDDVMDVTTKPIILDGDTGGLIEHFVYNVRTLERMGVSAVIIEDKTGLKKNSLFGTEVEQTQDSIENFCGKISAGKKALRTEEFMIIARIESLILERGMEDALNRAFAYTQAGADGIMIHSRKKEPDEILAFCRRFREKDAKTPIVVVPTSFNSITEEELAAAGVNIVIYANQLTRSAFPAMQSTAVEILKNHRALEVDSKLMPFREIIRLIDEI